MFMEGGKLRLESAIEKFSEAKPILKITHVTKLSDARDYFESGNILLDLCDVFHEKLQYFFYGRAEFRKESKLASDLNPDKPMCFVLKELDPDSIFTIFPFDSGAFDMEDGIKENYFPHISDVLELSIGSCISCIQKLISCFYGNNENFMQNNPRKKDDYDPLADLEVGSYIQLISRTGKSKLDGRASTPEIITHKPIPLSSVEFIIAPIQIQNSAYFDELCDTHDIMPLFYSCRTPLAEGAFISVIQDKLESITNP